MPGEYERPLLDGWKSAAVIILCFALHLILLFTIDHGCSGPLCGLQVVYAVGVCLVAWIFNLVLTALVRASFRNADKERRGMLACLIAAAFPFIAAWFVTRNSGPADELQAISPL